MATTVPNDPLVSGIVTDLIVGIILLAYTKRLEKRQARRGYEREVSVIRQHLHEALAQPDTPDFSNAAKSTPPKAEAVMNVIRDLPISLWHDELRGQRHLLDLVRNLQVSYTEFYTAALHFDQQLSGFARTFNAHEGQRFPKRSRNHSYILCSLQGTKPEDLLPYIATGGLKEIPSWVKEAYDVAEEDAAIQEAYTAYSTQRKNLEGHVEALANAVWSGAGF
jgi:hypothetical protein